MRFIVAVDEKWGIGKNRDLLLSIPGDMKYFRETTRRAVLVMGYNTLLSFPNSKPLPGRLNIVLADVPGLVVKGAVVCGSMEQLLALLQSFCSDDIYVIGGGSVYRQMMPYCDTAYITKMRFDGEADTFIPNLDEQPGWSAVEESAVTEYEGVAYSFVTYHNAAPVSLGFRGEDAQAPEVFVRKKEISFLLLQSDDPGYYADVAAWLRLRFYPLESGLSADGVARYLEKEEAARGSFLTYLQSKQLIAPSGEPQAVGTRGIELTVKREELDRITAVLRSGKPAQQILDDLEACAKA